MTDEAGFSSPRTDYFASMTDLTVGVLFVFMIMLMWFALQYAQSIVDVRAEIKQLQEDIETLRDIEQAQQHIMHSLQQLLEDAGVKVEVDAARNVIALPEDTFSFPTGSARLSQPQKQVLDTVGYALSSLLPCFNADVRQCYFKAPGGETASVHIPEGLLLSSVFVEGHTDNVPIRRGKYNDNWDLSAARAIATYRYLTDADEGKKSSRVESRRDKWHRILREEALSPKGEPLLSVSGYADLRPRRSPDAAAPNVPAPVVERIESANLTAQMRERNRRIEFRFIFDVSYRGRLEAIAKRLEALAQNDGN